MPNFPGKKTYPASADGFSIMLDAGPVDFAVPSGIQRGVTTADYNARLRGKSERPDKIPNPPYP